MAACSEVVDVKGIDDNLILPIMSSTCLYAVIKAAAR